MPEQTPTTPSVGAWHLQFSAVRSYVFTLLLVGVTTLLRLSLNPLLGRRAAFIIYFPALVFSAWLGGWGSGLLALALSTLAAVYLFISPIHSLVITNSVDQITLVMFLIVGLSVSALSTSQHKAQRLAEEARRQAQEAAATAQRSEQALQASEQKLRLALEGGGMGTWHRDLVTGHVDWPASSKALFGLPPDATLDRASVLAIIHPDDRPRVEAAMQAAIADGSEYREEYRIVWPDGSLHWIAARGRVHYDDAGKAVRMEGVVEDVTARRLLAEREHNIAAQLQEALQPDLPTSVPGLALGDYYRPAWDDQGVGGDFSDVFSDDKGITFLVVSDLSGKGLAAASQVATVRQMLRFALLNGRTVAGPIATLNRTLADHGLISGFATLFVGRYDAAARMLTYVNCGQDAGLVLRYSSGEIEPLPPTGPVLGAASIASYTEETVILEPGDVLALYSDGLTEAGPTRLSLLTGDGVAELLKQQHGISDPRGIVERLIAGVDSYAQGGIRDDQCLLIAVAHD